MNTGRHSSTPSPWSSPGNRNAAGSMRHPDVLTKVLSNSNLNQIQVECSPRGPFTFPNFPPLPQPLPQQSHPCILGTVVLLSFRRVLLNKIAVTYVSSRVFHLMSLQHRNVQHALDIAARAYQAPQQHSFSVVRPCSEPDLGTVSLSILSEVCGF